MFTGSQLLHLVGWLAGAWLFQKCVRDWKPWSLVTKRIRRG
jgi:hypothetical protein